MHWTKKKTDNEIESSTLTNRGKSINAQRQIKGDFYIFESVDETC